MAEELSSSTPYTLCYQRISNAYMESAHGIQCCPLAMKFNAQLGSGRHHYVGVMMADYGRLARLMRDMVRV